MTRQIVLWIVNAMLVIAVAAVAAFGGWQFVAKDRPAPLPLGDNADLRRTVTETAAADAAKLLTYSAATVEQDLAAALAVTTGEFTERYRTLTEQSVIPAARRRGITVTTTVVHAGVISIANPETASTLLFVTQVTRANDLAEPTTQASSLRVDLKKVDGSWLVERLDAQ